MYFMFLCNTVSAVPTKMAHMIYKPTKIHDKNDSMEEEYFMDPFCADAVLWKRPNLVMTSALCMQLILSFWNSLVCLFWLFRSHSTIFQSCLPGLNQAEVKVSWSLGLWWGSNPQPLDLESGTLPLIMSHYSLDPKHQAWSRVKVVFSGN